MGNMDSETLVNVFDIVKRYGHPNEKRMSKGLEDKYSSGEGMDFDDLMNLDSLYKSNFEKFSIKDVDNE